MVSTSCGLKEEKAHVESINADNSSLLSDSVEKSSENEKKSLDNNIKKYSMSDDIYVFEKENSLFLKTDNGEKMLIEGRVSEYDDAERIQFEKKIDNNRFVFTKFGYEWICGCGIYDISTDEIQFFKSMKYFDIAGSKLIMANSDLDYGAYGDLQYENESMYVCLYDIITKELSNTPILCRGCNITSSVDGSKIIVAREDYDIMYVYDVKTFEKIQTADKLMLSKLKLNTENLLKITITENEIKEKLMKYDWKIDEIITDTGENRRLVDEFGNEVRYSSGRGSLTFDENGTFLNIPAGTYDRAPCGEYSIQGNEITLKYTSGYIEEIKEVGILYYNEDRFVLIKQDGKKYIYVPEGLTSYGLQKKLNGEEIVDSDQKNYIVKKNDKYGIVSKNGDIVQNCIYDKIMSEIGYYGGLLGYIVTNDEKVGFLDSDNKFILEVNYDEIILFDKQSYFPICIFKENNKYGVAYYRQGILIKLKAEYDEIKDAGYYSDYLNIKKNGKNGSIRLEDGNVYLEE